jgi:hypothetical protein
MEPAPSFFLEKPSSLLVSPAKSLLADDFLEDLPSGAFLRARFHRLSVDDSRQELEH